MTPTRVVIPNSEIQVFDERLTSLCKLYKPNSDKPFAQFYVQTGSLGEAVVKGLDSPALTFSERRQIHKAMWSYIANNMGYTTGTMQRVKPDKEILTVTKSLSGYKK